MQIPFPVPLFELDSLVTNADNPLPMQYLGSKARIAGWILDQIRLEFPQVTTFIDAFAGTGSVAIEAAKKDYQLYINDIQPYAACILRSLFSLHREGLAEVVEQIGELNQDDHLLSRGRGIAASLLAEERHLFKSSRISSWRWEEYRDFCDSTVLIEGHDTEVEQLREKGDWDLFTKYYANTYFGVEQCLQLDVLRQFAASLTSESAKNHVIAATLTAMTYAVSSTTHLAQFLKPTTRKGAIHLVERRSVSIMDLVTKRLKNLSVYPLPKRPTRVYQADFRHILVEVPLNQQTVIYVDPPYFKEHYSRYYHVLDTFCLYDYPSLTFNERIGSTTIGRYRVDRTVSDFGLKSSVQNAFRDLFSSAFVSGSKLAVSYANTSLVSKEQMLQLATECNLSCRVCEVQLMHSGQGQPRNKNVTEYLFLLEPRQLTL